MYDRFENIIDQLDEDNCNWCDNSPCVCDITHKQAYYPPPGITKGD